MEDDKQPEILQMEDGHEELKELLKQNLEISKDMQAMLRHVNTYVAWQKIFGWLKFILILIPIVIGVLYLPPFIRDAYQQLIDLIKDNAGV